MPKRSPFPPKLTRRQAGQHLVRTALHAMGMCPSELMRLTGHSLTTITRYRDGKRVPTMGFVLDLIDKAPNLGFTFEQIAPRLGFGWSGSKNPRAYRRFSTYVAAVRIIEKCNRDQFAAKLGVAPREIKDLEHGALPTPTLLRKLCKIFIEPEFTSADLTSAFVILRAGNEMLELRERFLKFQHLDRDDPARREQENQIMVECAPLAKSIAEVVAARYRRPDLAKEVWSESLFFAVRNHDPRRAYLRDYLASYIRGSIRATIWSKTRVKIGSAMEEYGPAIREAEEFLQQDLGRSPSESEIAQHLDISPQIIRTVQMATMARETFLSDHIELVLQDARKAGSFNGIWSNTSEDRLAEHLRMSISSIDLELLYLHYDDQLPVEEIAAGSGMDRHEVLERLERAVAQIRPHWTSG